MFTRSPSMFDKPKLKYQPAPACAVRRVASRFDAPTPAHVLGLKPVTSRRLRCMIKESYFILSHPAMQHGMTDHLPKPRTSFPHPAKISRMIFKTIYFPDMEILFRAFVWPSNMTGNSLYIKSTVLEYINRLSIFRVATKSPFPSSHLSFYHSRLSPENTR